MSADAAAPKGIFLAFSAGDLVDRAPMLKMRLARIADPTARDTVARELRALRQTARRPESTLDAFCKTQRNDWEPLRSRGRHSGDGRAKTQTLAEGVKGAVLVRRRRRSA